MSVKKILVVDDSHTVRAVVKCTLVEAGYSVVTAAGGVEALELIKSERPALAVLDIRMPGMDGYAVCEEIKKLGQPFQRLPIIFLTALESHALELLGDQLGAYLQKPVKAPELLRVVGNVIGPASGQADSTPEAVSEDAAMTTSLTAADAGPTSLK